LSSFCSKRTGRHSACPAPLASQQVKRPFDLSAPATSRGGLTALHEWSRCR
jgi:hypothetical protein